MPETELLETVKNGLDRYAEALLQHGALLRILFDALEPARHGDVARAASKALLDLSRYLEASSAPDVRSRQDMRLVLERDGTSLSEVHARIERSHGACKSSERRDAIEAGVLESHRMIEDFGEALSSSVHGLPRSAAMPEIVRVDCGGEREALRAGAASTAWEIVAEELLRAGGGLIVAVWPAYYHLYVFTKPRLDLLGLQHVTRTIRECLDRHAAKLFSHARSASSAARARPIILPASGATALLASCYVNNPFKFYDFQYDKHVSDESFRDSIHDPPPQLVRAMALEAASHSLLTIRIDFTRTPGIDQTYRQFLRILRLGAFFGSSKIIVPLAAVPGIESTHSEWVLRMEQDYRTARSTDAQTFFDRYYPPVKEGLDTIVRDMHR